METFAERVIEFNKTLDFKGTLPKDIHIMNPFKNQDVLNVSTEFYRKYYNDNNPRYLILGINPGRFGAGVTGIPFTDTKRLKEICHINSYDGVSTHEPSSVFIYDMIDVYGGPEKFYGKFYISSVSPLGFIIDKGGKVINYNYYDKKELTSSVYNFIIENIKQQIALGVNTDTCFCFGTGKNKDFLDKLNNEFNFFGKIIALEHPRYIIQYKTKQKQDYIDKYIKAFENAI